MVVQKDLIPYNYHWQMSAKQLAYVVFVLVEKSREESPNDNPPVWWPKKIAYSHPMVLQSKKDPETIPKWKKHLIKIVENYYKFHGESWWFEEILKNTLSHVTCTEDEDNHTPRQIDQIATQNNGIEMKDNDTTLNNNVIEINDDVQLNNTDSQHNLQITSPQIQEKRKILTEVLNRQEMKKISQSNNTDSQHNLQNKSPQNQEKRKILTKVLNRKKMKKTSGKRKKDLMVRIKESSLAKLLPQPVVLLCDVLKYGLVDDKEQFLLKLNLMKSDKIIANKSRYKFRKLLVPKPPLKNKSKSPKKLPSMPPCHVKLTKLEDMPNPKPQPIKEKNVCESIETISISSSSSTKSSPICLPNTLSNKTPYVLLSPCTPVKFPAARQSIHSLSPQTHQTTLTKFLQLFKSPDTIKQTTQLFKSPDKMKKTSPKTLSMLQKQHSISSALKDKLGIEKNKKKKVNRKDVIKIKWKSPKIKMRISL